MKKFPTEWRDLAQKAIYKPDQGGKSGRHSGQRQKDGPKMWRLIKFLLFLVVLAALALIAYAYVGPIFFPADFAAPVEEVTKPVTLDVD